MTPADRRVAPRFQPAFGTVCRLAAADPLIGLVWNLSASGVSMLLADPPGPGTELPAELALEGRDAGLAVRLRVVHVRPVSTGDFLLGGRFGRPLTDDELAQFLTPPPREPGDGPPLPARVGDAPGGR